MSLQAGDIAIWDPRPSLLREMKEACIPLTTPILVEVVKDIYKDYIGRHLSSFIFDVRLLSGGPSRVWDAMAVRLRPAHPLLALAALADG